MADARRSAHFIRIADEAIAAAWPVKHAGKMRFPALGKQSLLGLWVRADRVVCDKLIESNAVRHALSS